MSPTPKPDWRHAGIEVRRRRVELDYTQPQLSAVGGPSPKTLSLIENGTPGEYTTRVIAKLEKALRWQPGSWAAVLAGGRGVPFAEAPVREDTSTEYEIMRDPSLDDAAKRVLVASYRALRRTPDDTETAVG